MTATAVVHWKDIVGQENLEMFIRIERAILKAQQIQSQDCVAAVKKTLNDDEAMEMWAEKRRYMRKCGYEVDGKIIRWLGWYTSYLEGGEIKFKTTAPPDRKYITLKAFLDFRQKLEHNAIEDAYYDKQEKTGMTSIKRAIEDIKKHSSIEYDDVFVREEEDKWNAL